MEATTGLDNQTRGLNLENEDLSLPSRAVLFSLLLLSVTLSILGNTITCFIVYRKKPMRSAINLLLTNIASADLVMSLTVAPFVMCNLLYIDISALVACICFSVLKDTSFSVASYTLLVISIDRYLIIVHRKDRLSPKFAKVIIFVIWCGSVFINVPKFFGFISDELIAIDRLICSYEIEHSLTNYKLAYILILLSVIFYIPVVIMFYMYGAILRTVRQSSKRIHNHSGSAVSISVTQYSSKLGLPTVAMPYRFAGDFNAKRKAFGTILLLFITLFFCWFPYTTSKLLTVNDRGNLLTETVLLTAGFLKSALYPVIFCARNKKFRTACLRFMPSSIKIPKTCLERKQRRVNPKVLYQCSESESRI